MAEEFSGISFPKSPLLPHGKAHGLVATELLSGDGQLCKALTGAHSALPPWPNRCSLNRGSPLLFRNLKSAVPGAPVQPCPDIQLEISRGARREGQGGWWGGGQARGRRPLSQGSSTCSCGPVPGQPGVPGVWRDLHADLLQPAAQLLQLLHLASM